MIILNRFAGEEDHPYPLVLPTFMVDDFGDEIQTIPGEYCVLKVAETTQVIVDEFAWYQSMRLARRAE